MPIEVVRIDDRLIHGQVVVGWCPQVKPDLLIVCDDEVAGSDWERQLYEQAAPEHETMICSTDETVQLIRQGRLKDERCFLIVSSPQTVVKLVELGFKPKSVIVGGMHFEPGKRKILDYVYIDDNDLESFRCLVKKNIKIECRDLPNCTPVDLPSLLGL